MEEKTIREKYEDEIDIYELLLILKKRIKLIGAIVFISIIITTIITFLMPNIYRARAIIYVDYFLTPVLLKNWQLVQQGMSDKIHFILPVENVHPKLNNICLSILNSVEFKNKILKIFQKNYEKKIINKKRFLKWDLAKIDRKTNTIKITYEHKDRKVAEAIVKIALDNFEKELKKLSKNYEKALFKNSYDLKNNNLFILNVIEKPLSLDEPVKPKKKLIIALSGISSLFIGVFLAFFLEWLNSVKESSRFCSAKEKV